MKFMPPDSPTAVYPIGKLPPGLDDDSEPPKAEVEPEPAPSLGLPTEFTPQVAAPVNRPTGAGAAKPLVLVAFVGGGMLLAAALLAAAASVLYLVQ